MKKLILICNAHIDPVWQWDWQEGVGVALSTFASAVKLSKEYDALIFNHNESHIYEWVEKYDNKLFQEIVALVKKKKWFIMGGWYIQPDCNIPCGESIIRHILRGREYFREKFNADSDVAVSFDAFGSSRGLVQILKRNAYRGYVACRPYNPKNKKKDYLWKGFNNSEILLHHASDGYCTKMGTVRDKINDYLQDMSEGECKVLFWGVGNHGGGPSRADLNDIKKLQEENAGKTDIIQGTLDDYFDEMEKRPLTVLTDDLYQLEGCFTSQIRIKQKHQRLENLLWYAEKIDAHAALNGAHSAKDELRKAESDLLFAEFHDILPGTTVKSGEEYALQLLSHGCEICERVIFDSFMFLANDRNPAEDGEYPIFLYNPHPYETEQIVECGLMLAEQNFDVNDIMVPVLSCNGESLECQLEQPSSLAPFDWRKKVVFKPKLKANSITRVNCKFIRNNSKKFPLHARRLEFSNGDMTVSISPVTGLIEKYAIGGKTIIAHGAQIEVIDYTYDTWGFRYNRYQHVAGVFKLMSPSEVAGFYGFSRETESVRVIEDGPIRTVVEAAFQYRQSKAVLRYFIPKKGCEIGVKIVLYNYETDKVLKLSFPFVPQVANFSGKTMYGLNDNLKTNGEEVVVQDYALLSDGETALNIVNFGNHGCCVKDNVFKVSLLQSAAYCAAPPDEDVLQQSDDPDAVVEVVPPDRFTERIDTGKREFEFILYGGGYREVFDSAEFNSLTAHQRPYALNYFPFESEIKKETKSLITFENKNISVSSCRYAGDGVVFRFFNNSLQKQAAEIYSEAGDARAEITLEPCEYKTYLLKERKWRETADDGELL